MRFCLAFLLMASAAGAQAPRLRSVHLDTAGVIRWDDDNSEVALFGANYAITSSSDFRAAGYVTNDRKKVIDDDMAHFARMGWTGMRLAFWGDWHNSDTLGNLIVNEHLDLLDYTIARARERGIYILFNPIHTYDAGWPDSMGTKWPGFAAHMRKDRLGTDSAAIRAQVNYLQQILRHVNPYTGVALKDEPSILFIEMINEPIHHPEDMAGSVRYINALAAAVRSTGSKAILFHNVSQDFRIAPAIRASTVPGASFGWYPTGLNSGHELEGNYLRTVDDYPMLRMPELAGRPRLVYEFDSADLLAGYMYPAMARVFRAGGVQLAAMFAYDMLATSSRNLGWQTHRLNMVYTPRKAVSAMIAAEAMRRLPRGQGPVGYPEDTRFGDFRVSYEENSSVLATSDAYMNAGATSVQPPAPERLTRVAGYGSSPVVEYEGEGIYFLDRIRAGVWRLEVYPDAVDVDDPFKMPRRDKIVTRAIARRWPMRIHLPELGETFTVQSLTQRGNGGARATEGRIAVRPGIYVLSAAGRVALSSLPARVGYLGMREFHAPPADTLPVRVLPHAPDHLVAGQPSTFRARVVSTESADSVVLWVRPLGAGWYHRYPMARVAAYDYAVTVPADSLPQGVYRWLVSVWKDRAVVTYPDGVRRAPWDWDFSTDSTWRIAVVRPDAPLRLLYPEADAATLAFTRLGDAGRSGLFQVIPASPAGSPVLHMELPARTAGLEHGDYTASLVVKDRVAARGVAMQGARSVSVTLRTLVPGQAVRLALMERDGTTWSTTISGDTAWRTQTIPLTSFHADSGVKLPQGFPGQWNYWVLPAQGRGAAGDSIHPQDIERLQLSLRSEPAAPGDTHPHGVEVESVSVLFGDGGSH